MFRASKPHKFKEESKNIISIKTKKNNNSPQIKKNDKPNYLSDCNSPPNSQRSLS